MKKNRNLMLLVVLIIIVSGMARAYPALAMSDKIIKQRIEDEAADTFHLRGTKVDLAVRETEMTKARLQIQLVMIIPVP